MLEPKDLKQIKTMIDESLERLAGMVGREFTRIYARFDKSDKERQEGFAKLDARIGQLSVRVDSLEVQIIDLRKAQDQTGKRLGQVQGRLDRMDERFDQMDSRLDRMGQEIADIKMTLRRMEAQQVSREEILALENRVETLEMRVLQWQKQKGENP